MRLLDVFVVVNGRLLGPFVATAPVDERGATRMPTGGDDILVLIRPRSEPITDRGHVWAKAKLDQ